MTNSEKPISSSTNPLLSRNGLPKFSAIKAEHIKPALEHVLRQQRHTLKQLEQPDTHSFEWALHLEYLQEEVGRIWGPVSHLNAVLSTPKFRDAYNECLPMITDFRSELSQNKMLYSGFLQLKKQLGPKDARAKLQLVTHALRDFRLGGVGLPEKSKKRFKAIMQELAQGQAKFEQNIMDATDAFQYHTEDQKVLAGIPEVVLGRAKVTAKDKDLKGWALPLDPPTYAAVMAHAQSRELRELYYRAWVTRASDEGSRTQQWDNRPLIEKILGLRHEAALLLGFGNYAELSLDTKMAASSNEVMEFLKGLSLRSRPVAEKEFAKLTDYAGERLSAWDVSFYAEQLKQDRFHLAEDELRPYFPLPKVRSGLFKVAEHLFGLKIKPKKGVDTWHPTVNFYEIQEKDGKPVGSFFTDLYARPNKRGGAWMDECLVKAKLQGLNQKPVAHLVCNFNPPVGSDPSLLTHQEVTTLFHEFGHSLHHLLTEVDYPSLSGINGVAWDAVELPSQFLENYAWLPEVLPWISGHYKTGEPLPADKLEKLNASRTFLSGLSMARQLEFALFDFRIHMEYDSSIRSQVEKIQTEVRNEISVLAPPSYNRFANSFSHIFGGGYAAGYYSYKWAEVLAADAFSAFEEQGNFDLDTAERFRRCILAVGGTRDALDAFVDFRSRPPSLEPLLRQSGIDSIRLTAT